MNEQGSYEHGNLANVLELKTKTNKQTKMKYIQYVDRQVGKSIKMLRMSVLIGRTFLGPTPSTEYINTYKYIQTN